MAFNIFRLIFKKMTGADSRTGNFLEAPLEYDDDAVRGLAVYLQKMAFWACVRRIGSTVALVDWDTYRRGQKVKAREHWAWNYEPNPNQTRSEFFSELVAQLYKEQEVLVVETRDGYRYVAETFSVEKKLSGNIYRDITSDGQPIGGTFTAADVIHLTIEGSKIKTMLLALAEMESKLMRATTTRLMHDAGSHGILRVDEIAEADPDFDETYNELINEKFRKYFTSDNAVLPLFNGYTYEDKSAATLGSTRDIRAMMDDILELTAEAFGIPPSIALGKGATADDFKNFMNGTIVPLVKMISEEINRKNYHRSLVYAGSYIAPNYAGVKYNDLFDIADPIDKLIGSGAFCVNDIRARLGATVIDEPWAWQHWMTKNYSPADDLVDGVADGKPLGDPRADPERVDTNTDPETPGEEGETHEQSETEDGSE